MLPDPAVSIVLIAYNDVEHLPAAADSALRQSIDDLELVVVDDGSTDGTADAADAVADGDARVRVLRLPHNSGGCSTPRNAGIEASRGEWVMFLDSDDLLEPRACEILLGAVRRHRADVAVGAMLRVDETSGLERRKFGWLYSHERVVEGLREWPELLLDVVVPNKVFRRSLLEEHAIRFPLDVLYEDMIFTARALALADRIAVVPDTVYRHRVREPSREPSISRRTDLAAFRDRVTVHRMMDAFLLDAGLPEVKLVKDVRFLQYDLRDHLTGLSDGDATYRASVVALARAYLDELDPRAFRMVRPLQRLVAALVGRGDTRVLTQLVRARAAAGVAARRVSSLLPDGVLDRVSAPGLPRRRS
jgi:CDP-glycerol glycerophosphotransferase